MKFVIFAILAVLFHKSLILPVLFYILISILPLKINYICAMKKIIILFTIMFFLWEVILASLKSANEISETWNINEFEIQSVKRSFEGPEPSFYTLKEVYCFGLIHKDLDISFPKNFIKIGNKCTLEFVNANLTFDLCNLKQEK
jgi:hypothetical protein